MRTLILRVYIVLVIGIVGTSITPVQALFVPEAPVNIPILDLAGIISTEQRQSLADKIAAERKRSTNQIGILTIKSLEGESLEEYSIEVAREWGIGEKDKDNGVLLLVSLEDRMVRIEVGHGLEGVLTDARSSRIIRNEITPQFKDGRYDEGISRGLDGIIAVLSEDSSYTQSLDNANDAEANGSIWQVAFFGIMFLSWIGSMLARSRSWWGGGIVGATIGGVVMLIIGIGLLTLVGFILSILFGLLFDFIVSRNYRAHRGSGTSPSWWAGGSLFGGGGGSSSGGFGGFGGGSFGGGGASGRW